MLGQPFFNPFASQYTRLYNCPQTLPIDIDFNKLNWRRNVGGASVLEKFKQSSAPMLTNPITRRRLKSINEVALSQTLSGNEVGVMESEASSDGVEPIDLCRTISRQRE